MAQNLLRNAVIGVGLVGIIAGLLVLVQIPAAEQHGEVTLSTVGIGILLVLFGVKTIAEREW